VIQTMEPRGTSHRRRKAGATGIAIAVALSMGLLTGPVAQAGDGGDNLKHKKHQVDVKLDDAHDEVLAFNKKVASATSKVIDAREQLPAARANLAAAIAEQQRTQRADDLAAQELDDATQEVLVAEQRLSQLEGRLRQLEADVGDFARRAYQMGPFAEVEMVLDAKDPSEFTDRLAAIRSVAQSNNAAMNEMNANRADMAYTELRLAALRDVANQKKQAAEARLQQAQEAARGAAAAKKIVDGLIQQEESALRVAKHHRADVKQQYADLAAEQERIQAKIAAAAARLQSSTGVKTNGDVNAIDNGAQWLFPLPGYAIGSDAGWRMHPILHYVRCHAGADIGAPSGAPIHAVDDGTVIEAGWEGGYGNFTVIAHGGGLTSGYGHQSRIIVHSGEQVKRGQIIGFVGTTGLSTGPHLHFEARVNGMPYSPKGWFGLGPKIPVCV
jgi:murein DD-endopeptidase MepM/ murein hydrolase activator NlpD